MRGWGNEQDAEVVARSLKPTNLLAALVVATSSPGPGQALAVQQSQERLGSVAFPTSCSPAVQPQFESSVALLHSFAWERAIRSFEQVADRDPACAMAYWGVAAANARIAWGPAYMQLEEGLRAIRHALEIGGETERERAYIHAMAQLFEHADSLDYATRLRRHVNAMERLHRRFPEESEGALFYAVALLGTVDATAPSQEVQLRAGALAESVFVERPNHPGAAHYIIHAYDYPELAERALPAAGRYAKIAPATPHARHMPSHIYSRLGLWQKSIDSNLSVLEVAGDAPIHAAHSLDYLVYAYLQRAEPEKAVGALQRLVELGREHAEEYDVAGHVVDASVRFVLERHAWEEAASLNLDPDLLYDPRFQATVALARAVGAARSGQIEEARRIAAGLPELHSQLVVGGEPYSAANVAIWHPVTLAWIHRAAGSNEEALQLMREAVRLDEAKSYVGSFEFGSDELVHTREELGALLFELGRFAEALEEFERSLDISPNRFNALFGAARAASLAGDSERAREHYEQLLKVADEDARGPAIEEAKRFLANEASPPNTARTWSGNMESPALTAPSLTKLRGRDKS